MQTTWTEELGRAWADDSWLSRSWLATSKGRARWFEPSDLVGRYQALAYEQGRCFEAAIAAVDKLPHLSICAGFLFRSEVTDRGIRHFWMTDRNGKVVDPALTMHGLPTGYLGGPVETEYVEFLARRAGVKMPEHLAGRLADRRRTENARQRRAALAAAA